MDEALCVIALDIRWPLWQNDLMTESRTLVFHIADRQGRPTMRTSRQSKADFMVKQGWTVTDVEVSTTAVALHRIGRAAAAAAVARHDNRDLCSSALRLGSL